MGFDTYGVEFITWCADRALVDFSLCCTLGRQAMNTTFSRGEFAEEYLAARGAKTIESIDASPYEGASLIHDMNEPIPTRHLGRFTALIDGGTLEHVYNFPQAVENCRRMIRLGGHFIGISPADRNCGHGFYQFSPELWYRALGELNGFHVKRMVWFQYGLGEWHDVPDPKVTGQRSSIQASDMVYLLILAQKLKDCPSVIPQQSDYVEMWKR